MFLKELCFTCQLCFLQQQPLMLRRCLQNCLFPCDLNLHLILEQSQSYLFVHSFPIVVCNCLHFLICNYVCFAWSRLSSECLREGIAKAFRLGIVKKNMLWTDVQSKLKTHVDEKVITTPT